MIDTLIVKSKIHDYIKLHDLNTSGSVIDGPIINEYIYALIDKAISSALANGRKTVMARDLLPPEDRDINFKEKKGKSWIELGVEYDEMNEYNKAIFSYRKALEIEPENINTLYKLGFVYKQRGDYDKAIKTLEKLSSLNPEFLAAWEQLGLCYYSLYKPRKARDALTRALELKPEQFKEWYILGNVYFDNNQYDRAINTYLKLLEMENETLEIMGVNLDELWENLGRSFSYQEETDKAIEAFEKAINLNPNNINVWIYFGKFYEENEQYDKAIEIYGKALSYHPNNFEILENLGIVYYMIEDYENAINSLAKSSDLDPDIFLTWFYLGKSYYKTENYKKAAKAFQNCTEIYPVDFESIYFLGLTQKLLRNYSMAIEAFNNALDLEDMYKHENKENDLEILRHIKEIYEDLNNSEKVIEYEKRIKEIDPKFRVETVDKEESVIQTIKEEESKERKYIKKILEYGLKKRGKIEKGELLRKFGFDVKDVNKYYNLIYGEISYDDAEKVNLEQKVNDVMGQYRKYDATLYDLVINMGYDIVYAKKIGKYLREEGWIKEFSRFPKKKELPEEGRKSRILAFTSYASLDSSFYHIPEIADELSSNSEIDNVLYWEEHNRDNIIEYMSKSLDKCDVMLLFCSPNSLTSKPVEKEWTAADVNDIPIIPIFTDIKYVPKYLRNREGVQFDPFNISETVEKLHKIILKKRRKG